jgi:hypothetical protein
MSERGEKYSEKSNYHPNPRTRKPWTQEHHKACIKYGDDSLKNGGYSPGGLKLWEQAIADEEPFAEGRTAMALLSHYKDYHDCEYPDDEKPYTPVKISRNNNNEENNDEEGSSDVPSSPTSKLLKRKLHLGSASKSNKSPRIDLATQTKLREDSRALPESETINLIDFMITSNPHLVKEWYDNRNEMPTLHCVRCHVQYYEDDNTDSCYQRHIGNIIVKPKKKGRNSQKTPDSFVYDCCGKDARNSIFCWKCTHTHEQDHVRYDEWEAEEGEEDESLQFRNVSHLGGLPEKTCVSCRPPPVQKEQPVKKIKRNRAKK